MEIAFRHRPRSQETLDQRFSAVIRGLGGLPQGWALQESDTPAIPRFDGWLRASCAFDCGSDHRTNVSLSFAYRDESYLVDRSDRDDYMIVRFHNENDYCNFARDVFVPCIELYSPYRAQGELDEALSLADWEEVKRQGDRTKKDIDGRDSVYRIQPLNFFDAVLTRRAFGLEPEEIAERLAGKVEKVSLAAQGVAIICTSEIIERDRILELERALRPLLR